MFDTYTYAIDIGAAGQLALADELLSQPLLFCLGAMEDASSNVNVLYIDT